MDGSVSFVVMEEAVLLCNWESRIILDWALDPRLVLDGIKDLVDGVLTE